MNEYSRKMLKVPTYNLLREQDMGKLPVLDVRNLGIDFGGLTAVDGFNITIGPTEISGLIGPNGAGKTTIFNLLTGVYQPTRGSVLINGIDIKGMKATAITDVNLDDFYLIAVMTPDHRDNLRYYDVPREKIYVLNEDKGGIFDPYGGSQPLYNICRDEITEEVKILIERLRSEV